MSTQRTLKVILPANWSEVPGRSPREYRRQAPGAGVLQVSLRPPQPQLRDKPDAVLPWLRAFTQKLMPELEGVVHEQELDADAGPGAFSLRRSKRFGLVGVWAVAGEAVVFATYIMGSPETAREEIEDAMIIVQGAHFDEGQP